LKTTIDYFGDKALKEDAIEVTPKKVEKLIKSLAG